MFHIFDENDNFWEDDVLVQVALNKKSFKNIVRAVKGIDAYTIILLKDIISELCPEMVEVELQDITRISF